MRSNIFNRISKVAIHADIFSVNTFFCLILDGTLLAVGSHDNFIYLYSVSENARKYSRYGKCTVSSKVE